MNEENKKETQNAKIQGEDDQKQDAQNEESSLSEEDLKQVSGGNLQISGIKGESQEDQHKDWIEIL